MFEIGTTLRQARERRQIGLDRVEAETKIRARYLRALEDEDFDALPGPTFVRGFLRAYAAHLGLDGQLFVDEYNSRYFDPIDDDLAPRRRPTARERRNRKRESHVIAAASYPGGSGSPAPLPAATAAPVPTTAGNPQLTATQATGEAAPETTPAGGVVRIVAGDVPCFVTVYEGKGTDGRVLFSNLLDADTDVKTAKLPRVEGGYTFEVGKAGVIEVEVDGRTLFAPDTMNVFWFDPGTGTDVFEELT
jgi:cytoskeleton protein RodZ